MNISSKGLLFTLLVSTSLTAFAGQPLPACKVSDVKITTVQLLDGSPAGTLPVPENASNCLGAYSGQNNLFTNPVQNLGYDDDGWFNTEDYLGLWDGPGAFIDDADLLDLDGDGDMDDPGWVYVGKEDLDSGYVPQTSSNGLESYTFIDNLITFSDCKNKNGGTESSCFGGEAVSGNWAYNPPTTNPEALTDLLGGNFFDQVAIVFKAGKSFAMYNFNIFDLGLPPVLAGQPNFAFTGTWDISKVLNNKGLSNFSFLARDPINVASVPEPSSWALMLFASLFIYRQRKNKV
jgi:hypothetical protein